MHPTRSASLVACFVLLLAMGCGTPSQRLVAPERSGVAPEVATPAGTLGLDGPRICFFNAFLDHCYPDGGYLATPEREIPVQVRAGAPVAMNWSAIAAPGTAIQRHRWAVDIADLFDETPRADESTDLAHWSAWSATATPVTLGPWTDGEVHKLYVVVGDDQGLQSLGIVRFEVSAGANHDPDCGGAVAELAVAGPRARSFAGVTIHGVTDPDGDPVTITVTGVTQDEPLDGPGDGHTCPDAMIEDGAASVRVERSGSGNGRVYTLAFTATDGHGGSCEGTVDVCIPHGRAPNRACAKDDLVVNSLGSCATP